MAPVRPKKGEEIFLGIDIGTTNCKVAVGNRRGDIFKIEEEPCRLEYPRAGWVEVDPEEGWWRPFTSALRSLLSKAGLKGHEIRGVGVSCTNSLVCLDEKGEPVRNAIMQLDRRSIGEAERIGRLIGPEEVFRLTGNRIAAGTFSAPSLLWIRREEEDRFRRIRTVLSPSGYLACRLTGNRVMDPTRAATTLLYDIRSGKWSESIIRSMDLPEEIFPAILPSSAVAGRITAEASRMTGLQSGTPVIAGVMDSVAAAIGMGTTRPGEIGIILGTVGRILWPLEGPSFDDRFLNVPLPGSEGWMSIACTNGTGLSLNWFGDVVSKGKRPLSRAYLLRLLDEEASLSPPGADGLLYLPFIAGERSPIWDPMARGVFFGLDSRHTRGDLVRAIMEGTAFSIRDNLEILGTVTGRRPEVIRLSGGGARSPIWPEILSSVLGRDLRVSSRVESECAGALILSAIGYGEGEETRWPSPIPAEREKSIPGDPGSKKRYDGLFRLYRDLYRDLMPHYKRLYDLSMESDTEMEMVR